MTEQGYQTKIIKAIEAIGGHVVNGTYSKSGEADLQCGYPIHIDTGALTDTEKGYLVMAYGTAVLDETITTRLLHLCVEVKTEKDYHRVMNSLTLVGDTYSINEKNSLKKHEPLQVAKINKVRLQGGLALFAYDFKQVEEYVNERQ